ncbi:hypothetical protein EDB89DRAFT_2078485 [Lactarius sanguifluus]|nr:hypothetical protein EDB89DRAFT_2078485 [Lactarius sanguifluus]
MSRRLLTEEEKTRIPVYFDTPFFDLDDKLYQAEFGNQIVISPTGRFPWKNALTQKVLTIQDFEKVFPHIQKVRKLDWIILEGSFKKKNVHWSFPQNRWLYGNNRAVRFSDSEEQSESEKSLTPLSPENAPDSDSEQEEVSRILEETTKSLTGLLSQVASRPSSPRVSPGPLPSAPGPSRLHRHIAATSINSPPRLPSPPLTHRATVPPRSRSPSPQALPPTLPPVPALPPVPPPVPVHMAANPPAKILGAAPEPFDGRPNKAEAFWNNLENYFHLNASIFDTDDKKISAALNLLQVGHFCGRVGPG